MRVVFLAKDRHADEPAFKQFLELGAARGHEAWRYDKKVFVAQDLARVDVVCLKSYIDDRQIWDKIDAHGVRAVNARAASERCAHRGRLDRMLRGGGVRTPRCADTAEEVMRLGYPIYCKTNSMNAEREVCVLHAPPAEIDCEHYFYQEWVANGGVTYKTYCIGADTFLVEETQAEDDAWAAQRRTIPLVPVRLAEVAQSVGRITGLEVYGADLVGAPDEPFVIDVNPFPSFRAVPQAADALWNVLERRGARSV